MTKYETMEAIKEACNRGEIPRGTEIRHNRHQTTGKAGWQLTQGFSSEWFPTIQAVAKELGVTSTIR